MKRLLRISFDIFLTSFTSIISWFFIGLIIDKNLTNVFSLTYPLQCLMGVIVSIFGVGANISIYRDKNENAGVNGLFYGVIVSILLFGFITFNCERYIAFMNMDSTIYLIFCRYSILQILLQTILQLVLIKYYYSDENQKSNRVVVLFNSLNFLVLIIAALITKDQLLSSTITLIALTIFDVLLLFKNFGKIDFKLNVKNCFKYDSVSCSISIMFFILYLFGFSNSFAFGEKYVVAITFATLVTDIQWDITGAIKTDVKIDIVKKTFDYEDHLKNASKLVALLIISILLVSLLIYPIYQPNLAVASIFISLHIINFMITPVSEIKLCYLELEDSATKTTINTIVAYLIRTVICFLPTPYCTIIGQMCSSFYEFIYAQMRYAKKLN